MYELDENVVNDAQEQVVDVPTTEPETSEVAEQAEEVANPLKVQSPEENSKFAEFRRAKEQAEREAQEVRREAEETIKGLNDFGFSGKTLREIKQEIEARSQGLEIEEYLEMQNEEQSKLDEIISKDPRIIEAEELKRQVTFDNDLKKIKEAYPDETSNDVLALGDIFIDLMQKGTDPVLAYEVQRRHNEKTIKTPPPTIGRVNSINTQGKDFFTSEEVDRLTDKDYDNDPTLFDKVRRSMYKWK